RFNYLFVGGLHPIGFHVLNIALHCVISVLIINVFAILIGGLAYDGKGKRLSQAPKASFLAALLFGSASSSHRKCNKQDKFSIPWILFSILLCAVAMLCKEQGITVLVCVNATIDILMICKVNVLKRNQRLLHKGKPSENNELLKRGFLTRMGLLTLGGSSLLYIRWRIMGTGPPAFTEVDNPDSFADSILEQTVNYNYYYSLNAWLLLCPWWLCFDWSMGCVPLIKSVNDCRIISLVVLWICLIGLSQALCSKNSHKRRTVIFGLVLLVVTFLPASNLFLYANLNQHVDALNAWRNATVLKPDHSLAWNNMVILLDSTDNLAQAEMIGKESLKLLPKDHTIMFSLAYVLGKLKKYKESEGLFHTVLKINPHIASYHGNLAVLYHRWGKLDLAKKHYELSLKLDPAATGTKENYTMLTRKLEQLHKKGTA
ncbi:TMTC4 protein, partial [Polyodon spathula]|nr:TMTC4 protein [Polyodon spathula]